MKISLVYLLFCFALYCETPPSQSNFSINNWGAQFAKNQKYISKSFALPVGIKGSGKSYYVAQGFGVKNKRFGGNFHLGEDWNGAGGGNTDYGDPVYAISSGLVVFVGFGGPGWGDVVRIIHCVKKRNTEIFYESVYGHVSEIFVKEGEFVSHGQKIASIGDAGGIYPAHLH
ncbi:MAG: M23 family metallopeptidase, partial [Chitinophagaceae bacterium]|nr:M23 family metallopeptidase [Chitinophagaceae bacterium]